MVFNRYVDYADHRSFIMKYFLFIVIFFSFLSFKKGADSSKEQFLATYHSLDPTSLSELFAFHELYPDTKEGKEAILKVWELIYRHKKEKFSYVDQLLLPSIDIKTLISIVNKEPYEEATKLTEQQLFVLETLSSHLHHRKLKGHYEVTCNKLAQLPSEEIDLARALLLYQYQSDPENLLQVRRYEASLDLMALQILAKLKVDASDLEKIDAINDFIFHQMQFRFPPHSLMAKDIDVYTFLPSVIDNRKGVCLGVSILILSLAQRLDLPLEIVTPPGHIYVRYHSEKTLLNIETTCRGVHMPTENYLGINTYKLSTRTMKEVVGMAFFNQASVFWGQKNYANAAECYERAKLFMPDDPLVTMFLSIQYLMIGKETEGKELLSSIKGATFPDTIYKEVFAEDVLNYKIEKWAIEAVYQRVDETRESILKKQKELKAVLNKYPYFRGALMQLATSYLQLGRTKEALEILKKYHQLDKHDPTVNYYLSILCYERMRYKEAWEFFDLMKLKLLEKNHTPQSLKALEFELRTAEPSLLHSS